MQALLSRAVEEQVTEQRAVSTVLADLRGQVNALGEAVRRSATDDTVQRLGSVVSTVVADLRTSTSLLGQRLEALATRVDAVAATTAAPTEQAAVRLTALAADVAAQGEAVDRMSTALEQLSGFPSALAGVQQDVSRVHDRMAPITELRAEVGDLSARTQRALDGLLPQLEVLQAKVDALGNVPDPERLRDAVVDALGGRLDGLVQAAERPVIGPEALQSALGDTRSAVVAAVAEDLDDVTAALGAVENRLGQLGERLADVSDTVGGVPGLTRDLTRLSERVEELQGLRAPLDQVLAGLGRLEGDTTSAQVIEELAEVRADLVALDHRFSDLTPRPIEEIAAQVSIRVADRLVETLAPRIADVVLTRVSAVLVNQLGAALSPTMRADTELVVRAVTEDSERRVLAHVDEAVLALAEALLRRRRGGRPGLEAGAPATPAVAMPPVPAAPTDADAAAPGEPTESVVEVLDRLSASADLDEAPSAVSLDKPTDKITDKITEKPAEPDARPAVTTSEAPAPEPSPPSAKAEPQAEPEPEAKQPEQKPVKAEAPPEPKAASKTSESKPASATTSAPATKTTPRPPSTPPSQSAKKSARPPSRPPQRPILDRTPDVPDDDIEPVRERPRPQAAPPSRPAPQPVSRPTVPPSVPPSVPPPVPPPVPAVTPSGAPPAKAAPQAPPPAQTTLPGAREDEGKRKPWWRPGG